MITKIEHIAKICHQANKAYCESLGDTSQPEWNDAPEWQKKSAIKGVNAVLDDPEGVSPEKSHEGWLREKLLTGWKYGKIKDPEKKEHPCMLPYEDLPLEQKVKDDLFLAIAKVFV